MMENDKTSRGLALLRSTVKAWEDIKVAERAHWDSHGAGKALCEVVVPLLKTEGVCRFRLMDNPSLHSVEDLCGLICALASEIGFVVPQTYDNNLTALIQNQDKDYASHKTRGHQTNAELSFHSDRSDVNVMMYVRCAAKGGEVSIVSYADAVRELEVVDPAALKILFQDFPVDLRDQRIFQTPEWHCRPLLWCKDGKVRGHYIRRFITDSQRHPDCPRLTVEQIRALDAFDAVLERLKPTGTFSPVPGDFLCFDNYRVVHAREKFEDESGNLNGRLCIRSWVAPYHSEELPDFLLPLAGSLTAGSYRGGIGFGPSYHQLLGCIRSAQTLET